MFLNETLFVCVVLSVVHSLVHFVVLFVLSDLFVLQLHSAVVTVSVTVTATAVAAASEDAGVNESIV